MNGEAFQLLDLGAGDGAKTKILIDYFSNEKANFTYVPIDIDGNILKSLQENLEKDYPALNLKPVNAEYREALEWLKINSKQKKMVLFMGGNIGNFEKGAALDFLSGMKEALNPGDLLLTGIDLKKDPKTILNAYDDPKGVTAEFNYNLLERINRELEADFVISQWQHYATYDPVSGATQSFLVSKIKQQVNIQGLDSTFHFDSWEPIHTEYSMKYAIEEINQMAGKCGFERVENYFSAKNWFVDALWRVA
jgi:L-histidine N-alpha-methyltransferase